MVVAATVPTAIPEDWSTSLDPLETSQHPLPSETTSQSTIHRRHAEDRRRILEALNNDPQSRFAKRLSRLCDCCAYPTVIELSSGVPGIRLGRCRDRLCPLCARLRGQRCAAKTVAVVKQMNAPRFLTLTLRPENRTLAETVAFLQESFRTLRRTQLWKRCVTGGVYALELTWSRADNHAHLHLHAIIDGNYIPHGLLKNAWQNITGGSEIVDIRSVHDREQSAAYISKYVAKPIDLERWTEEQIREYAAAMHSVRMLQTFGKAHGKNIDAAEEEEPVSAVAPLISVAKLRRAIDAADPVAIDAARRLHALGGWWRHVLPPPAEPLPELKEPPDAATLAQLIEDLRQVDAQFPDGCPPPTPEAEATHAPCRAVFDEDLPGFPTPRPVPYR
jgi:hypothetical protein